MFNLSPVDPLTIALAACLLTAVSATADFTAAGRALRADPLVALRCE